VGQPGFFDLDRRLKAISAKGDPLQALNALVPFESFRAEIEAVVRLAAEERKSNAGRKPFDAVMMFKVLVLQTLYNLADEQVEYQIRDRLSFMRFLGLGLEDTVPDATTVWLFREALAKAGLVKPLFERFNQHLDAKGYIARGGQIVDATIVNAPKQHNTREVLTDRRRWKPSSRSRATRAGFIVGVPVTIHSLSASRPPTPRARGCAPA